MTLFDESGRAMASAALRPVRLTETQRTGSGFRAGTMAIGGFATAPAYGDHSPAPESGPDDYARGYADAIAAAQVTRARDQAGFSALLAATEALTQTPSDDLAQLIVATVEMLLTKVIGAAPVDRDMLIADAQACAALINEASAAHSIWLHPSDVKLIGDAVAGVPIRPDHQAQPGSVRIEWASGAIEGGRTAKLAEIRRALGMNGDAT